MTKTTSGFTIIELLVVITVIGILSSIGLTNFSRYQTGTADSQRSAKATVLSEALEKYYDKNGEYPGCPAVTGAASVVTTTVLPGVDVLALLTPKSAVGDTNSIKCLDLTGAAGEADIFAYVGNSDTSCTSGAACEQFSLKYKEEATGTIKSITSRRYPAELPTPVAPTVATTATAGSITTYSWPATTCTVGTVKYQYSYSGGYTAGWSAPTTSLSTTLDTSGLGLTYTISVQAKCAAVNAASPWSTSGQASYYRSTIIADNFNRTAGSLGGTSTGGFPWTALSGTWSTNGTIATTPAVNSSNPLATINYGSANVDASVGVSSGGGDALYLRVTDATNWIRARVRTWTTSVQTYHPSSYYVDTSYYTPTSYYTDTSYYNSAYWSCSGWAYSYSSSAPNASAYGFWYNYDSYGNAVWYYTVLGPNTYSTNYAKTNVYSRSCSLISGYWTYSGYWTNSGYWTYSGYWADNSYYTTDNTNHYTVILEKSVAGVITTLGTSAELSAPTSLRLRAVGTSIGVFTNGGATAVLNATEASFTTVGKHGIGRGLSDNDGQGLDNFTIDAL